MNSARDRDRLLQLLVFNEEILVNASHQLALITSLPFVHTARRSYRLDESMSLLESGRETTSVVERLLKIMQICSSRGRRSRNKVSVGEPAEGSITFTTQKHTPSKKQAWSSRTAHFFLFTHIHQWFLNKQNTNQNPPFNDGSLGSCNDEERRETRYVM